MLGLLNLSCRDISWEHLCLKLPCLLGCRPLHLQVLLDALLPWPETSPFLLLFFFGALRLLPVKCLRLAILLTTLVRLRLPIFLQLPAALGCRTNKAWVLSQVCRVMPRQRPLVPDSSSCGLPLRVPTSSLPVPFPPQIQVTCSHFPPFLVRSFTHCDYATEAVTS